MKRTLLALALLLCSGGAPYADEKPEKPAVKSPAPADTPSLKLPASLNGDTNDFIQIAADTNCNVVVWRVVDPGLKLFPTNLLRDTKTAVVTSGTPGRYRVWAVTALGGVPSEIAECVVVVGTPLPPGPPPPPGPVSDLTKALQAAYALDGPDQPSLTMLTNLYSGMAVSVQTPEIQAKTGGTNAGTSKWCKETIEAPITNLGTTKLVNVRKAIAAEVSSKWGAKVAPLTPADASKELAAIAQALSGVK